MKRIHILALGLVPVAALVLTTAALGESQGNHFSNKDDSGMKRGLEIAPPLNLKGKNRDLVGLGSYIVNAQGACNDCHTCPPYTPEHDPYTGGDGRPNFENYLAGGTAFGPFVSRNLTPDAKGRPAGLTLTEFMRVMHTGHDPDNPGELLQVMPWPIYGKMVDRDLKAVYEFLRAIPHAEPGPDCAQPPD